MLRQLGLKDFRGFKIYVTGPGNKMNNQAFSLAERLIPSTYVQQGLNAKKTRENQIRHFIEHVSNLNSSQTIMII